MSQQMEDSFECPVVKPTGKCAGNDISKMHHEDRITKQSDLSEDYDPDERPSSPDQDTLLSWVGRSDAESRTPSPELRCQPMPVTRRVWAALDETKDEVEDPIPKTSGRSKARGPKTSSDANVRTGKAIGAVIKDKNKTPAGSNGSIKAAAPNEAFSALEKSMEERMRIPIPDPLGWTVQPQWKQYMSKVTQWARCCETCVMIWGNRTVFCGRCGQQNTCLDPQFYQYFEGRMRREVLEWNLDFYNAPKVDTGTPYGNPILYDNWPRRSR